MTSFWKTATPIAAATVICGATVLWPPVKERTIQRELDQAMVNDRVLAENGDPQSQFRMGVRCAHGQGVPQNHADAVRWYRKAADQGHAKGQYGLAHLYYEGNGIPRDFVQAVHWFGKAADQGDTQAQHALAYMYLKGYGVPQNSAEAVRWYRKAADQSDEQAERDLAFMYREGKGVPRSSAEAAHWYRKAASHGDRQAALILVDMYREGVGVPKNYFEAARWYGRVVASCFEGSQGRPYGPSALMAALGLAILAFFAPQRGLGHYSWLPCALLFASAGLMLIRELRSAPEPSEWKFALYAGLTVLCAVRGVIEAASGSKRSGDGGQSSHETVVSSS